MRKPYSIRVVEMAHGNRDFAELVQERRDLGMSWREIAADLGHGLSHQTVWRHGGAAIDAADESVAVR